MSFHFLFYACGSVGCGMYICACIFMCVGRCICAHACVGSRLDVQYLPPYTLTQSLSLNPELLGSATLVSQLAMEIQFLPTAIASGLQPHMAFSVGSGDLNSQFHDCWADALLAQPSLQPAPINVFLNINNTNVNILLKVCILGRTNWKNME